MSAEFPLEKISHTKWITPLGHGFVALPSIFFQFVRQNSKMGTLETALRNSNVPKNSLEYWIGIKQPQQPVVNNFDDLARIVWIRSTLRCGRSGKRKIPPYNTLYFFLPKNSVFSGKCWQPKPCAERFPYTSAILSDSIKVQK
ncbi:unnamed protein product, partial [Nesidiocoris tenuis]